MNDTLPVIPIPLKLGDADAAVPLQEVFDIVYQRARYDLSVKYDAPLDPPLNQDKLWLVRSPPNLLKANCRILTIHTGGVSS